MERFDFASFIRSAGEVFVTGFWSDPLPLPERGDSGAPPIEQQYGGGVRLGF